MAEDNALPAEEGEAHQLPHLPDLQIPEPGHTLTAISVRTTAQADLVEILVRLREAGAEVVTINSFPATKGEPDVTRVFDIEMRDISGADAAGIAATVPGVALAEARPTLGQIFGK